jgi:RNA polymerase sigma factor (sigma-70 family)
MAERRGGDDDTGGDEPASDAESDPLPDVDDLFPDTGEASPEEQLRFRRSFRSTREAFDKRVRRKLARAKIPPASQEQLHADVFEILFVRGSKKPPVNVPATLDGIVYRVLANYERRRMRRPPRVDGFELDRVAAPVNVEARVHALVRASEAFDQLSEREQLVFQWADIEGLEYAEVAEKLGVPTGTVCSWLRAARRKFREAAGPPSEKKGTAT